MRQLSTFLLAAGVLFAAMPAAASNDHLGLPKPSALHADVKSLLAEGGAPALGADLRKQLGEDMVALAHALHRDELPLAAMYAGEFDQGGGAGSEDRVLAFILGLIPGFGLGHLITDDEDGFFFYLIVDLAVLAAYVVLDVLFSLPNAVEALMVLGWIGIHVLQGVDAYRGARGGRASWLEEPGDTRFASLPGKGDEWRATASGRDNVFSFSF